MKLSHWQTKNLTRAEGSSPRLQSIHRSALRGQPKRNYQATFHPSLEVKIMNLRPALLAAILMSAGMFVDTAQAATDTVNMPVTITIQNACDVSTVAPTTLNFGTAGPLTANVDSTSVITVTCTTGATYDIGLDGGGSTNVAARVMTRSSESVGYQLYQEATHTTVWGNTVATDTIASTGTGTAQTFTVYGRVPPQAAPTAGVYNDTVLVTVTY
ncbi:MAG: spore coat U domain-containing protein [Azoarcus sp.]|nr:spore coat U domain-containing protein [Azoarcus sp.]